MKSSKRNHKIFFAHQFSSSVENSTQVRAAVRDAVERCSAAWNSYHRGSQIELVYKSMDDIPAEAESDIFNAVIDSIAESDICIFSLTDHNRNVIFELGYAIGKQKQNIWMLNKRIGFETLPADYRNRFILSYDGPNDLRDKLESEIQERVGRILGIETPDYFFSEFWNLREKTSASVVAPPLPHEDRPKYARKDNVNYLKFSSFADVDAVVHLIKFLPRVFDVDCEEFTSETWKKPIHGPTIFIGSPIWNEPARRFYNYERERPIGSVLPATFEPVEGQEFDAIIYEDVPRTPERLDATSIEEFGLFGRVLDPDTGEPVFIAAGCTTHGTLAALRAFDQSEHGKRNCMAVLKSVEQSAEFFTLFRCRVRQGIPATPNLSNEDQVVVVTKL